MPFTEDVLAEFEESNSRTTRTMREYVKNLADRVEVARNAPPEKFFGKVVEPTMTVSDRATMKLSFKVAGDAGLMVAMTLSGRTLYKLFTAVNADLMKPESIEGKLLSLRYEDGTYILEEGGSPQIPLGVKVATLADDTELYVGSLILGKDEPERTEFFGIVYEGAPSGTFSVIRQDFKNGGGKVVSGYGTTWLLSPAQVVRLAEEDEFDDLNALTNFF